MIAGCLQWNWCQFQPVNAMNASIKTDETWDDLYIEYPSQCFYRSGDDRVYHKTKWLRLVFYITLFLLEALLFFKWSCWIFWRTKCCKNVRVFFAELLYRTRGSQKARNTSKNRCLTTKSFDHQSLVDDIILHCNPLLNVLLLKPFDVFVVPKTEHFTPFFP